MKEATALRRVAYPRVDVIDRLFAERHEITGTDTSADAARAALTGLHWNTFYKLRRGIDALGAERPMKASNELITALMTLFPDVPFAEMFDAREEAA